MVAYGKLAGFPKVDLVMAWKKVDFPTFARPTYREFVSNKQGLNEYASKVVQFHSSSCFLVSQGGSSPL